VAKSNAERQADWRKRLAARAEEAQKTAEKLERVSLAYGQEKTRTAALMREIKALRSEMRDMKNKDRGDRELIWRRGILDALYEAQFLDKNQRAWILGRFGITLKKCQEAAGIYYDFCLCGPAADILSKLAPLFNEEGRVSERYVLPWERLVRLTPQGGGYGR
jgi:hypothetical protein